MENRVNQVVNLANGDSYIILKQAIYKNDSYFIASKLGKDNKPMSNNITFFRQIISDNHIKLEEVNDVVLRQYLYTYMKI